MSKKSQNKLQSPNITAENHGIELAVKFIGNSYLSHP